MSYVVKFDRIGRTHAVPPLVSHAKTRELLGEHIYRYARPHLRSRDVELIFDDDQQGGFIACGMHVGGHFKIEVQP